MFYNNVSSLEAVCENKSVLNILGSGFGSDLAFLSRTAFGATWKVLGVFTYIEGMAKVGSIIHITRGLSGFVPT